MRGLQDEQFKEYYTQLLQLDWTGYDVWAVGGIVSDWDTYDIDLVVFGERDEERIYSLFEQVKTIGPFSPFWTTDERAVNLDRTSRKPTLIHVGYQTPAYPNKLRFRTFKFPMTKQYLRMKQGLYHGAPIQLIQNGSQVYF